MIDDGADGEDIMICAIQANKICVCTSSKMPSQQSVYRTADKAELGVTSLLPNTK